MDKDEKSVVAVGKNNSEWQRFLDLGANRKISLNTKPEPYEFDRTLRWLACQVAPIWKLTMKLDEVNQSNIIIVVIGIYLEFKREFSKLIGFLVIALVAVGLNFNAYGVKVVLLNPFNRIIGD